MVIHGGKEGPEAKCDRTGDVLRVVGEGLLPEWRLLGLFGGYERKLGG